MCQQIRFAGSVSCILFGPFEAVGAWDRVSRRFGHPYLGLVARARFEPMLGHPSASVACRLKSIRAVLLDLDGTLYLSGRLFPETLGFLGQLKARGIRSLFLTNNSSRGTPEYVRKLHGMGINADPQEILTSGWATIHHILSETPYRILYLLGTPGLRAEFEEAGLQIIDDSDAQTEPDAVVIGFDTTLTYQRIQTFAGWLLAGKPYLATHPDVSCPMDPFPIPDTGSMIEMFATATGRRPYVIGKPEPPMVRAALDRLGALPTETAMIGDRLQTDMRMARENGLLAVLVLTGMTQRGDLDSSEVQPDVVLENVGDFAALLPPV